MARPVSGGEQDAWREPAALVALQEFFSGHRFPVLTVSALGTFAAMLVGLMLFPEGESGAAAFAAEFRQWCFALDPATGRMEWGYVLMALLSPLSLGALIAATWWGTMRSALRSQRGSTCRMALAGAALVLVGCGGLVAFGGAETGALPFPAVDLRTSAPLPPFRLVDQAGEPYSPQDDRGRVLLVTAIYARCSSTCPMLFAGAKDALSKLTPEERAQVTLVAVTLDPARDDAVALKALAEAHGLSRPGSRLLSDEPAAVERALDLLSVSRTRDEATGLIEHQNVFVLVDRRGLVAYRLTLGERSRSWLLSGLRTLLAEEAPVLGAGTT